jgi:hypothetical protein
MTEQAMTLPLLYRGLLYALREKLDEREARFDADGDQFHAAFRSMLEFAQANVPVVPARELLDNFDPVFGVSPEATEMLLEGERDFIVSLLNPRLRVAQFKISKDVATKELNSLPSADVFRKLATRFHEQLAAG